MTMKLTQLLTYWNADEADVIISFLGELRESLLAAYGDDIAGVHREATDDQNENINTVTGKGIDF